jgi:hypothetical protein
VYRRSSLDGRHSSAVVYLETAATKSFQPETDARTESTCEILAVE